MKKMGKIEEKDFILILSISNLDLSTKEDFSEVETFFMIYSTSKEPKPSTICPYNILLKKSIFYKI